MIAKCNYCGKSFDAKRNTARFCSDLHRTLFGKLSQDEKTKKFIEYIESVSTADKIPIPDKSKIDVIETNMKDSIKEYEQDLDYGKRLRQFAALNKTDCDTIFSGLMDNYGKKGKTSTIEGKEANRGTLQDFTKENAVGKPYNPNNNWLYKSKMAKSGKHSPTE